MKIFSRLLQFFPAIFIISAKGEIFMKRILATVLLGMFVFGVSANVENNFAVTPEYFASSADKDKMLDDKLRKQVEKKRAEQLEKKAKG